MKYPALLNKLNNNPVAILPQYHKEIIASAESMISGDFDITDLFDDVPPIYEERGNVAIININGVLLPSCSKIEKLLGCCSYKDIRGAIKQAEISNAENVILNINSCGGVVQGVKETAKAIQKLNKVKDTTTYVDELCASAGYWLASQSKSFLCSESASIGSIGVYIAILTMEKQLALQGIEANVIQAGKFKTLGLACKDLTEEEKTLLQDCVDDTYQEFKNAVAHRGLDDSIMQGSVYDGDNAYEINLVDGIQNDFEELVSFLQ